MDEITALAARAQDDDHRAAEAFVRATQADVWRFCAHLGGSEHADDLTQETYLRAWRALPAFRFESSARTWLLSIARRACADHVRHQVRGRDREARLRVQAQTSPSSVPGPTAAFEVSALVAGLGNERLEAFVLTQVLGLSYEEAAAACECPIGTIRSRVARARADLVAAFDADAPAPRRHA